MGCQFLLICTGCDNNCTQTISFNLIFWIECLQLFLSFNTCDNEILLLLGSSRISKAKFVLSAEMVQNVKIVKNLQLIIAVLNKMEEE